VVQQSGYMERAMTETIVVAYRPIGFNYHHKYIIYNSVNSDGSTTA